MKKIIKKYRVAFIILLFVFAWEIYGIVNINNQYNNSLSAHQEILAKCTDITTDFCNEFRGHGITPKMDTFSTFFYLIINELRPLQLLGPLLVIIPSLLYIYPKFRMGYLKNILTRTNYKNFLINIYKDCLTYIWILPAILIFGFIISYIFSRHFNYQQTQTYYENISIISNKHFSVLPMFILIYFINIILHSIFYINLSLISLRKNRNLLVNYIFTYFVFISITIFSELVVGGIIFSKVLGITGISDLMNLFNIWVYDGISNLGLTIIYSLLLIIISFIVLIKIYQNKEGVIIENEK